MKAANNAHISGVPTPIMAWDNYGGMNPFEKWRTGQMFRGCKSKSCRRNNRKII
jgi:hypothetical protein